MLKGVHAIIITPFRPDGDVDFESLETLTDGVVNKGVQGVTALGIAAEAQKLTHLERLEVGHRIFDVVGGRCSIIVGTSANRTDEAVEASQWAEAAGAQGVMVAAPHGLRFGPALTAHYAEIGRAIGIPIMLQDYFETTGVDLSPENMAELIAKVPTIRSIKLESEPTPARIAETRRLVGSEISILGGIGAVHLFDELLSGADGTMTGFAYPEILLQIWRGFNDGNPKAAESAYRQYQSLLEFEGQPGIGLAIRKEILRRRGLIRHALVRGQPPLPDEVLDALDQIVAETGAATSFD